MSKVISMDVLNPDSVDKAIKQIKKMKSAVDQVKLVELVRQLANLGKDYAQSCFAMACYDGVNDVVVDASDVIYRDGEAIATLTASSALGVVLFIEFGTGVVYPDSASARAMLEKDSGVVGRGEYGDGHGKQYTWAYYADPALREDVKLTHGNPSNACMYMTIKHLESVVAPLAKGVLKW